MSETIGDIVAAHRSGAVTPEQTIRRSYARIRAYGDPAVFISLRDEEDAVAEARALAASGPEGKPLYGVPIVLDASFTADDLLVFPGNTHVEAVRLRCGDYERLERPIRLALAIAEPKAGSVSEGIPH